MSRRRLFFLTITFVAVSFTFVVSAERTDVSVKGLFQKLSTIFYFDDASDVSQWETDWQTATVFSVIDGDTIELSNGDRVRYIGIDTPERMKPSVPAQCFAEEASVFNSHLVEGKTVRLGRDISDRDRYGRLLRYVFVDDIFVNAELVRAGYAFAANFPPDISKQELFRSLEHEARANQRGLWADDACH